MDAVSYTHLRAHETGRNLVCRLLLEKKWLCKQYGVDIVLFWIDLKPFEFVLINIFGFEHVTNIHDHSF